MKSGQGELDTSAFVDTAMDIVMEMLTKATILAGYYVKACGRKTLTSYDLNYCMKYTAMNFQSTPEIMDQFNSDEEDDDDMEVVDEEDDPFVRYSGKDKIMKKINTAYDNWETWVPQSPIQKRFKDAVDNIEV
jgi:hypothetical protein